MFEFKAENGSAVEPSECGDEFSSVERPDFDRSVSGSCHYPLRVEFKAVDAIGVPFQSPDSWLERFEILLTLFRSVESVRELVIYRVHARRRCTGRSGSGSSPHPSSLELESFAVQHSPIELERGAAQGIDIRDPSRAKKDTTPTPPQNRSLSYRGWRRLEEKTCRVSRTFGFPEPPSIIAPVKVPCRAERLSGMIRSRGGEERLGSGGGM